MTNPEQIPCSVPWCCALAVGGGHCAVHAKMGPDYRPDPPDEPEREPSPQPPSLKKGPDREPGGIDASEWFGDGDG